MKKTNLSKYLVFIFCILMLGLIVAGGLLNLKVLKTLKSNSVFSRDIFNDTKKVIGTNSEAFDAIQKNNNRELFSDAVGVCNRKCTLTSCESINTGDFLATITPNMKVLEIGPYSAPFFKGKNVKYFDVMDKEGIKHQILFDQEEAIKNTVESNISNIPNIDYVNPNGNMDAIKEKFDIVFSAHNIEHQVDLINHLNQVANVLKSGGKFYIIIPDKRYCFDHFIPESSLSDVIDNHYKYSLTHPLKSILEMNCETTHNDARLHWEGDHGQIKGKNFECYSDSIKSFNDKKGEYINTHRWRFTPQQFEFIVTELRKMGLISLKIETIYVTQENTQEFKAILYKP